MQRSTTAGLIGVAVALAATAACSGDGSEAGGTEGGGTATESFDEARLVEMVNETARLTAELDAVELRVQQRCLEDQGFTVHDRLYFAPGPEPVETETLFDYYPYDGWLLEQEDAERFGFGSWRMTDEGRESDLAAEYDEYHGIDAMDDALAAGSPEAGGTLFENDAFEALSPQDQYDWYIAFYGEAIASDENGYLIGEDRAPAEEDAEGEIDMEEQPDYVEPEPGGCKREMIDALYGDMELFVEGGEGEEYSAAYWRYRPEDPLEDFEGMAGVQTEYRERIAGVEGELVDCLAERGRPGWEFGEEGSLPISDYLYELYTGEADVHDHPDLPDDAPADFEGKLAFEIALAVDVAECGDETGFRETAHQAHEDTQADYYLSIETEVYAWQDEVRGILTQAQELLEA
ncbi:hypothetical protein AB0A73_01925 [Glycomyces sp. NPDC047369]